MTNSKGLLDSGFARLLNKATTPEELKSVIQEFPSPYSESSTSVEEEIRASRDFYHEYQAAIDPAVRALNKIVKSPEGAAKVELLQDKLKYIAQEQVRNGNITANSEVNFENLKGTEAIDDIIFDLIDTEEFSQAQELASAQGLKGISIGGVIDISILIPGFAFGYDFVIGFRDGTITKRGWVAVSLGLDLSIGLPLSIGFWVEIPHKTLIGGWFFDLPVGLLLESPIPVGIRLTTVTALARNSSNDVEGLKRRHIFTKKFNAIAIQIAEAGAGFAHYWGGQTGKTIPQRITFEALNAETNVASIAVGETATLNATLSKSESYDIEFTQDQTTFSMS